jgi:hypothetical protein
MKRLTPLKIFAVAALFSAVAAVSRVAVGAGDTTLRDISRYRSWSRVNDEPMHVELSTAGG